MVAPTSRFGVWIFFFLLPLDLVLRTREGLLLGFLGLGFRNTKSAADL
jgi:hypothetical protein